jgi:cytochrome c biogenesis protein CcmG, thiol:disulfide interchange protein DsbE
MAVRGPTISKRSWIPLSVMAIGLAGVWTVGNLVGAEWRQSTPNRITPATLPETGGPRSGYPAPGFAVPGLAGGQVTLAQYAGHPRVVSFFASWCESCWNDIATLERAYSRYRDQGLVILGVGVQDTAGSLRYVAMQLHVTFPVGYDNNGSLAARAYELYSIPTTVFVDADGMVRASVQGRVHSDTLQKYLALILPAAATPQ